MAKHVENLKKKKGGSSKTAFSFFNEMAKQGWTSNIVTHWIMAIDS